jgi:hypothetical protein
MARLRDSRPELPWAENRSAPATSLCAYLQAIGAVFAEAEELIETVLAPPREVKLIGTD